MGGDDSQKLLPWRGSYSSPGRRSPVHCKLNTLTQPNSFFGVTYFPEKYPSASFPNDLNAATPKHGGGLGRNSQARIEASDTS